MLQRNTPGSTTSLLQSKLTKPSWFFRKLSGINNQKLYAYQNVSNTIRESLGAWYGMSNLVTSAFNVATSLGMPKIPWGIFKPVAGVSLGGAALTLYHAIQFGRADAESHAVSNKQIERTAASKDGEVESKGAGVTISQIAADPLASVAEATHDDEKPESMVQVTFAPENEGGDPVTVSITERQYHISKYHWYNDVFKDMSDYMLYVNIVEEVFTQLGAVPAYSEDEWVRPTVKAALNIGFFGAVAVARVLDFKTTILSYVGENEQEAAEKRLYHVV